MRLNLGSGDWPLEGYVNVDLYSDNADVNGDFTEMDFEYVEEIEMSHILEHIPWSKMTPTMERVHSWMVPGGAIRIEVPDMQFFIERGVYDLAAQIAFYGIQSAPGEYHMAGFTEATLRQLLAETGFTVRSTRRFFSDHKARPNFPCLEATATA